MKQADTTKKSDTAAPEPAKKLYRLPEEGKIAGVCAGLAEYLELDVTLVRLVFVILTLASGGFGIVVYIILALVMPVGTAAAPGGKNIGENVQTLAKEVKSNGGLNRLRNYTGGILVALGAWLLLVQFFPSWAWFNWDVVWPAVLVIFGLALVLKGRK